MDLKTGKIIVNIGIIFIGILYLTLMVSIMISYFSTPKFLIQTDIISFLTGAKIIRDGKTDLLYDIKTQFEYQKTVVSPDKRNFLLPFRNFPITALFYIPFIDTTLRDSFLLIFVLNVCLLLLFHFAFIRNIPISGNLKYLFLLPLFYYPSVSNFIVGQYTPVILLIFLAIYLTIRKEKSFRVGFFTSLLFIKPQYLLFTPFSLALSKNRKQYLVGFILGVLLFISANLIITKNIKPFLDYPNFILSTENPSFGSRPYQMFTFFGLTKQVLPQIDPGYLLIGNYFIYVLLSFLVIAKTKKENHQLLLLPCLKPRHLCRGCSKYSRLTGLIASDKIPRPSGRGSLFVLGIILTILFSVHALAHDLLVLLLPLYLGISNGKKLNLVVSILLFIFPLISFIMPSWLLVFILLGMFFTILIYPFF